MRKTVLYIAMSLDGYIADRDGGVGWLAGDGSDPDHPGSYPDFLRTVDTVVMGYRTYRQIVTELSPDRWVYAGLKSFVLTHRPLASTDEIRFTDKDPCLLAAELRAAPGRDIWILGGAEVAQQLLNGGQIDQLRITVVPILLGDGIPLFARREKALPLKLVSSGCCDGMTELIYEPR